MGLKKGDKIERGVNINVAKFKKDFTEFRVNKGWSITRACEETLISATIYNRILKGSKIDPQTVLKLRGHIEVEIA